VDYLGAEEAVPGNVKKLSLKSPASMNELIQDGLIPFTVGPVYVYAGVDDDIINRFAGENILGLKEVRVATFPFQHAVLVRCELWNYEIQAMDKDSYEKFQQWMQIQLFINKKEKNIFAPRLYRPPLMDPFAYQKNNTRTPTAMDVYSVNSMKSSLVPLSFIDNKVLTNTYIDFQRLGPEPEIVELGKKMLETVGV
jgi:hypothetical protein